MFSFSHSSLLESHREQEIEATLHCVMAVQEAVPVEDSPHLRRIFGPDILGRLPKTGDERCRRTALHLIGASFASSNSARYSPCTPHRQLRIVVHDPTDTSGRGDDTVPAHGCDHLRRVSSDGSCAMSLRCERFARSVRYESHCVGSAYQCVRGAACKFDRGAGEIQLLSLCQSFPDHGLCPGHREGEDIGINRKRDTGPTTDRGHPAS